ncbi:putative E3 ubiquitin-protein ligase RING1a isoform X1 [Solanum dulcamara]|uniref:putative E3 ubiquitin-protein ligase RING1a isoform X1 n=1 Tax=Solanum dulcamara TaxID=45834 RepID=UPI002485E580|nr:putative E3 ubiquitin-protein ligase RING1a isoform X1 [Solanum dulcamara]
MPAQKRFLSNYQDDDNNDDDDENSSEQQQQQQQQHRRRKQSRRAMEEQQQEVEEEEGEEEEDEQGQTQDDEDGDDREGKNQSSDDDSEGSGTDPEAFDELIAVSRSELRTNDFNERSFLAQLFQARKDLECPICLGIIKRTRVVMGCQHRFCRECIDKSMRLGNNECPACRIHCASRRSLRDDPGFDTLIEAIYPDVEKYEQEELVFLEEERALNEQIQASIAKISQRQSEALIKRRKGGKDIASPSTQRTPRNYHAYSRRKRNSQGTEPERSDPNESENDDHDEIKDSPLKDERGTQTKFRKHRRRKVAPTTQTSPSTASPDGGHIETAVQLPRVTLSNSPGPALKPETLTWGRGGVRSHGRHGSGGSRNARNTRLSKLVDYLDSARANDDELNIHLEIIPLDKQATPSLKKPHICCTPSTSVGQLCELVAQETKSQANDVELLAVKINSAVGNSTINHSILMDASNMLPGAVNGSNVTLECLQRQDTVGGISSRCTLNKNLVLVYVQKNSGV